MEKISAQQTKEQRQNSLDKINTFIPNYFYSFSDWNNPNPEYSGWFRSYGELADRMETEQIENENRDWTFENAFQCSKSQFIDIMFSEFGQLVPLNENGVAI